MIREQLYFYLQNFAGLTALIGSNIFPQRIPTGKTLPNVSFEFAGRDPQYFQAGLDDSNEVVVIIDSHGSTMASAVDVADQVFTALDIQIQTFGDTGNTVYLHSTTLESESDDFDLVDGSEDGVRTITQTYTIRYKET